PNFGKEVEMYSDSAWFRLPVKVSKDAKGEQKASITVRFMSCDDRMCLPPRNVDVPVMFTVAGAPVADAPPPAGTTASDPEATVETGSATEQINKAKQQGLLAFIWLSISFGFLALLTPCVFPMIPITVSFFTKQRESGSGGSAIGQALAYSLGIILTFTALGLVVASIFKAAGVNALASNPWLNLALAALFIALALNLFGVFEVRLPYGLANKVSPQGKGKFVAPLMMAFAFTITSFTCTMPLVGTLLVGASQGEFFYAIVGMISFSTAFATPFFLLALFPQAIGKLPKSGAWMVVVKAFLGFLEIAAAVKFLSNVDLTWQLGWLTRPVFLAVWALVMLVAGLYMMGWLRLPTIDDGRIGWIRRAVGLASIATGLWFLGSINGRPLGELDAFLPPTPYPGQEALASADEAKWLDSYDEALALAKAEGRPIFIDFTGVTCTNCRWMEKNMFPREDVVQRFDRYILVKLYTDRPTESDRKNQELQQKLTQSVALPTYVALSPEGKPVKILEGSTRQPEDFVQFLDAGLKQFLAAR
ncbi:MAG TPA: cytochrome c biogenesis protein CcdA, partial [Fimbriimonas sp.]